MAGLTIAVILLPQSIAFALVAELPPEMGIYAAIIGAIVGGLWGSSDQVHTGPTNATSILVLSALLSSTNNPTEFIIAAGLLGIMSGIFQLVMGLARLGMLVNFVSHSVIVGFAAGGGILIMFKQLRHVFGIEIAGRSIPDIIIGVISQVPDYHIPTTLIGIGAIIFIIIQRHINRRFPGPLVAMIIASALVFIFKLDQYGVGVIGELPQGLPPMMNINDILNLELISRLSTGALAVGAIGLVSTMAMTRTLATETGQRLDSNQEFVGQGLANILSGLFTGYPVAGSLSRSVINLQAGAKTPMSSVFSSLFLLIAIFTISPLAAYLPRAALAGVLIATATSLVDVPEMKRIIRGTPGDATIMLVTFFGTLFLSIEFAVLAGIMFSFAFYILRTSAPTVNAVVPDENFRHFIHDPRQDQCPQLGILDIQGDLYFGAVNHIEEAILAHQRIHPEQRYILLRMHNVNQCDFSGIHMLENVVRVYRDKGGDVFFVRTHPKIMDVMEATKFTRLVGTDHFFTEDKAIYHFFHHILDPAICIYECPVRVFRECQNLPKFINTGLTTRLNPLDNDLQIDEIDPLTLWRKLHEPSPPLVIDVRQPREYHQSHITEAQLYPLPDLLRRRPSFPSNTTIVIVCRSGRRSRRAAQILLETGEQNIAVLTGGMLAWQSAGLLEAVEWQAMLRNTEYFAENF